MAHVARRLAPQSSATFVLRRDSVSEVLRGNDLRTWGKAIDLHEVARDDELLRFTECDAVGRCACLASLPRPATDVNDASR